MLGAQQPNAHAEEGGDENEVEIEAENVDVAGGVADQRELEEEDQR
jgi:hypothetical protein